MVKLKLYTPATLKVLVQYTELVIKSMIEQHQSMDITNTNAFYLNGRIELMQHLLRKLKIKQIDMKNNTTIKLYDLQATILMDYNQQFAIDIFSKNEIMNYSSVIHKQLSNNQLN